MNLCWLEFQGTNVRASEIEAFAVEFVRAYWETVKSNSFAMPPNEPIEETVEELIAGVSHTIEMDSPCSGLNVFKLHMADQHGSWWNFHFQKTAKIWSLVGATARSDDDTKPHNLLDEFHVAFFGPFLKHTTEVANRRTGA